MNGEICLVQPDQVNYIDGHDKVVGAGFFPSDIILEYVMLACLALRLSYLSL